MNKALEWLRRAADLDPTDDRIASVIRSCGFTLQTIDGMYTADVLLGINSAASQSWFDTFTAMMLVRDPNLHPGYAPHVEQLISVAVAHRGLTARGPQPLPKRRTDAHARSDGVRCCWPICWPSAASHSFSVPT